MRAYVDGVCPSGLGNFHESSTPRSVDTSVYVHGESGSVLMCRGRPHPVRYEDGPIETARVAGRRALVDRGRIVRGGAGFQLPHPSVEERVERRFYGKPRSKVEFVTEHSDGSCTDCYFETRNGTQSDLLEGIATLMTDLNFCPG